MDGHPPGVTIVKMSDTPWITILTNVAFEDDLRDLVRERSPLFRKDLGIAVVRLDVEHDMVFDKQDRLAAIQIRQLIAF